MEMEEIVLLITWIGQACFVLQAGDTTILMDPIPAKMGYEVQPISADVVTVSHEHHDHNYVELAKGRPIVLRGLPQEGKEWKAFEFSNKDVKITVFPSFHDAERGAKRGQNALFLIETKGIRVLHLGDLGHALSKDTVKKIGRVDVLMIPVGGYYTIDAKEAKAEIARLKPRVVIPMHYKTKRTPGLPIAEAEDFLAGWENVYRPEGKSMPLAAGLARFPKGQTTIVVLPYEGTAK